MKRNFNLRLEEKTIETLREISAAEKRPMGNIVRLIVEDRLEQLEAQKGWLANAGT